MKFLDFLQFCYDASISFAVDNDQLKVNAPQGALTPDVVQRLRQFKPELLEFLQRSAANAGMPAQRFDPIRPVARNANLPVSYGQEQSWLAQNQDDAGDASHFARVVELAGELDLDALNKTFTTVFQRHEALRTVFAERDEALFQTILPVPTIAIPVSDLRALDGPERGEALAALHRQLASAPFDLTRDLMLRLHLIRLDQHRHQLVIVLHHIASDGWSLGILVDEFRILYTAYSQGVTPSLAALPAQYADYAAWTRAPHQIEALKASLGYWTERLGGAPELHSLLTDRPRQARRSFKAIFAHTRIDEATTYALKQFAQRTGCTLFMVLETMFASLIACRSQASDVVIGTPVANRPHQDTAGLIGYFVNMLALRHQIDGHASMLQLLAQAKQDIVAAFNHGHVPFAQVVRAVATGRSTSHGPLVQIAFALQNNDIADLDLTGLSCTLSEPRRMNTLFDLSLEATETGSEIRLCWEYASDLFEPETVERMARSFAQLVRATLANPDTPLCQLTLLDAAEHRQLLLEWTDTTAHFPRERCIHELFEQHAARHPDAVAVVFEDRQLSYGELNARANQLAHYLVTDRQVKPDTLVGICLERSLEMVVAMLGIVKAGGAYVPLDPDYPPARLEYMLADARPATVLTHTGLLERLPAGAAHAVCLDAAGVQQLLAALPAADVAPAARGLDAGRLAYVIYTSGSTGNPKGVMIEHRSVVNLAFNLRRMGLCGEGQGWGWFASYAFDASVQGLTQLAMGCPLTVIADPRRRDPALLSALLDTLQAIDCTPMVVEAWLAAGLGARLPNLIIGGEPISPKLWAQLRQWQANHGRRAVNVYGPTECTVDASGCVIDGAVPHIGKMLANSKAYVLNEAGMPAALGVAGELHIGGVGLARGYLNRLDLTAEKFVVNPFHDARDPSSSERLYRTGDLVRWLADGNLEYLDRIDHQVKIRGFRIELGEIENALASHPQVKEAVVLAKDAAAGDKRLVAYVVTNAAGVDTRDVGETQAAAHQALIDELRRHLAGKLPDYMLPAAYVPLASLPLNPSGKIDRKALPEPDASQQQARYVAPRSELEALLCSLWQDVLGVDRVGVTDNFFQLGGHSLSATRLVARINQARQVVLPLRAVFQSQTLEALAQEVARLDAAAGVPALRKVSRDQPLLPSYGQQRLWMLDRIEGGSAHYNMPAALRLHGALDLDALNRAFTTIVARHESLRTCFAEGADGQALQVIGPVRPFAVAATDLSALADGERQLKLVEWLAEEASRVFDLSRDPMLRVCLLKTAPDEHVLLVTMHHIASDGWSVAILINEFSALYRAYALGQPDPLAPLAIQYADYAHWQRNWLQGEVLEQQLGYWTRQLAGLPVVHSLPLDHPRPTMQTFAGAAIASQIDASTADALHALCQASGATLFMGLHAAFSVLLARYSNETDIVVGSPIANREQAEVAGLIGFFVNTLVLRCDLSGDPGFAELLGQSKTMLLDAYAHQQVPFEQIVERLQPARSLSHGALFQIMLVMQNNESGTLELPALTVSPVEQDKAVARYDLRLNIDEGAHGLSLEWDYNTDLFEEATIARMARHFGVLLASLVAAPQASVFTVDMLPPAEREALLAIAVEGDQAVIVTRPRLLHARVLEQIRASGDSVAVKTASRTLTYRELGALSGKLAMRLVAQGALPNTLVGVVMEKGWEQVVAVLGILRSGAAYLPIDANLPEERIALLLKLGEVSQLVTTPKHVARLPADAGLAVIEIDADFEHGQGQDCESWTATDRCGVDDLAYVIFTSGSTGAPKGVMIDHKGAANTVDDMCARHELGPRDSVLGLSNLNFDLSVFDIFGLLAVGGKLVLPTSAEVNDPDAWLAYLRDEAVTIWNTVPAFMQILTQQEIGAHWQPALRLILMSGDWIPTELPAKIAEKFPLARQISLGGATEASIWSIAYPIDDVHAERKSIPYGKAMTGQHMYVLQGDLRPAPYGVSGDIYIGGIGVALGYWRDEQKTAASFLTHPDRGVRLYRTGDLGCLRTDGNIEFLGRIDHQVKIRGFRIELGEIENALTSHAQVTDAVVLARDFAGGGKRLVAYVVASDAGIDMQDQGEAAQEARRALVEDLRRHLGSSLPDYMMPSAYVPLASLPLSANGKVDRKALPEPDASQQQATYVAPRTETERRLCALWQEVLGVERVGITDNFFQLGGHSLLVMKLITELKSGFGTDLPIKVFFQFPDLQGLAACLDVINPAPSSKSQQNDGRDSEEEMEAFQL